MTASAVPRPYCRQLAGLLAALTCSLPVHAADSPRAWLDRMAVAVDGLNYSGKLVHVYGGESTVLSVVQRVEAGKATERLTAGDGSREIIRSADEVICILTDQRTVLVEQHDPQAPGASPIRGHLPGPAGIDATLYHVALGERDRIAGRDALGIVIRPKDGFRYGYRLWLDRATAMPLKTQLVDEQGAVLEQVLFTEISLPQHLPREAVQPSIAVSTFAVRRAPATASAPAGEPVNSWSASELPPGFRLTARQARSADGPGSGLWHLVYSDGLATVSLFVEPAVAAAEQAEGLSQIGAANAYTANFDGYMVTAIGSVPARTVEVLAQSARPTGAP